MELTEKKLQKVIPNKEYNTVIEEVASEIYSFKRIFNLPKEYTFDISEKLIKRGKKLKKEKNSLYRKIGELTEEIILLSENITEKEKNSYIKNPPTLAYKVEELLKF